MNLKKQYYKVSNLFQRVINWLTMTTITTDAPTTTIVIKPTEEKVDDVLNDME